MPSWPSRRKSRIAKSNAVVIFSGHRVRGLAQRDSIQAILRLRCVEYSPPGKNAEAFYCRTLVPEGDYMKHDHCHWHEICVYERRRLHFLRKG